MATTGRLVLLCGPSCVGKSPLLHALQRDRPDLTASLEPVVLYNDRAPRPGEVDGVDYHFRSRQAIESLRSEDRYVVMEVRGDLQALDLETLEARLDEGDAIFEGNPYVGAALLREPRLEEVRRLSLFVSPLSGDEIRAMQDDPRIDVERTVADVMRRKLLRRTRWHKGELSRPDLDNVENRAGRAYHELGFAPRFDWVLPNHDGEDSEHWDALPLPLGDARRTLIAVAAALEGRDPAGGERWDAGMFE